MITFKAIRYRNLLNTGNIFTEIDLNSHRMTLIVGHNGAGKSTCFDAIAYVLYNKTIKDLNAPQLINTMTQKGLLVEIEFETNKNHYMVSRGKKPDIFEIYKDGVLLNQDANKKADQDFLEKSILKMNFKSFKQIVLMSSTDFKPFMQLSTTDRRTVIEDLLDIQVFSVMNSILKDDISANKAAIRDIDDRIYSIKGKIELNNMHLREMESNNQELIDEKNGKISILQAENVRLEALVADISVQITELSFKEAPRKSTEKAVSKLSMKKAHCKNLVGEVTKEIRFYEANSDCPVCKQAISDTFKTEQINNKQESIRNLETISEELAHEISSKTALVNELSEYSNKIRILNSEMVSYSTSIAQNNIYISDLEKEIRRLNKKNTAIRKDESEEFNKLLALAQDDKMRAIEDREILNVSSVLLKDGGIKARVIKQYIPTMNRLISKFLKQMDFEVLFGLDENFNEKVTSRFADTFTYNSFSQGLKMRIDIALMLTWREISRMRNSVSTNLLLLDETFDSSLDDRGDEDVMNILKTVIRDANIIMISHKFNMADKFDRVIEFKSEKGFSRIVN